MYHNKGDGKLKYANNSNYKKDIMIRKEGWYSCCFIFKTSDYKWSILVKVNRCVVDEFKKIISDSKIVEKDDSVWPEPDRVGRQELEIRMGSTHISFTVINLLVIKNKCSLR